MSSLRRAIAASLSRRVIELRIALGMFGLRGWTLAIAGAFATLVVVGVFASLIENPLFDRKLAARPQDYVIWVSTAALGGLILGTYAVAPALTNQGKAASGGLLSAIAVGCPVCNKIAVALLGTSGALNFFGPSQIFIGIASLLLLSWTLLLRVQAVAGTCPIDERNALLTLGRSP